MVNALEKEEEKTRGRRECCGVRASLDALNWSWVGGEKPWLPLPGWFHAGWARGGARWKSACNVP